MGSQGFMPPNPDGIQDEADLLHGGTNEMDGDRTAIDYVPLNYTRTTSPAEVDDVKQLTAHLAGMDAQIVASTNSVLENVRNETGFDIDKGDLLAVVGFSVPENRTLVGLADKDVEVAACVVWANEDILNNTNGVGLKVGELSGVDTSGFTIGELLILGNAGVAIGEVAQGTGHTGHFQGVGVVTRVGVGDGRILCHVGTVDSVHDEQYDALLGTSGTPSNTNRYATDADPRIPTQDENNALVGTSGAPSTSNKYVTNADPRNAAGSVTIASATGDTTTASATDTPVAGMLVVAPANGDYIASFTGSNDHDTTNSNVWFSIHNEGVQQAESERAWHRGGSSGNVGSSFTCQTTVMTLTAADEITGEWRTDSATATCHERVLTLTRVA